MQCETCRPGFANIPINRRKKPPGQTHSPGGIQYIDILAVAAAAARATSTTGVELLAHSRDRRRACVQWRHGSPPAGVRCRQWSAATRWTSSRCHNRWSLAIQAIRSAAEHNTHPSRLFIWPELSLLSQSAEDTFRSPCASICATVSRTTKTNPTGKQRQQSPPLSNGCETHNRAPPLTAPTTRAAFEAGCRC